MKKLLILITLIFGMYNFVSAQSYSFLQGTWNVVTHCKGMSSHVGTIYFKLKGKSLSMYELNNLGEITHKTKLKKAAYKKDRLKLVTVDDFPGMGTMTDTYVLRKVNNRKMTGKLFMEDDIIANYAPPSAPGSIYDLGPTECTCTMIKVK